MARADKEDIAWGKVGAFLGAIALFISCIISVTSTLVAKHEHLDNKKVLYNECKDTNELKLVTQTALSVLVIKAREIPDPQLRAEEITKLRKEADALIQRKCK